MFQKAIDHLVGRKIHLKRILRRGGFLAPQDIALGQVYCDLCNKLKP